MPQEQPQIRVRMYRIGFGDCFLVSLPKEDGGHYHILVDCGVHSGGDLGLTPQIVANIAAETGRRLDVIIATHAHKDHISGFDRRGADFAAFSIGEVWVPWTWNDQDPRAAALRNNQETLTAQLVQHLAALQAAGAPVNETAAEIIANLRDNARAIALLKAGFGVTSAVRYVKAGQTWPESDSASLIPGLAVRFLGPPEDEKFLAQMDPPKGAGYLRLNAAPDDPPGGQAIKPFPDRWTLKQLPEEFAYLTPSEVELKNLTEMVDNPIAGLAFTLDNARNNESIVALLTYRGQYLLFPGDAQYGNWRAWLEQSGAAEILPKINFFKIAHHGSHNATPKAALEKMSDGQFAAMISTQRKPWPSIPKLELLERLDQKTRSRIVRSDWLHLEGAPDPAAKFPPRPAQLPAGFVQGDFWFDYLIDL